MSIFQITRLVLGGVFISSILLFACTDESCGDEVRSMVNFGFYTMSSGIARDTTPIFSAKGVVVGDSVFIKKTSKLDKFSLPLSPNDENLAYILTFHYSLYENDTVQVIDTILQVPDTIWLSETTIDTILIVPDTIRIDSAFVKTIPKSKSDTLIFNYETQLKLVSPACGFTANYLLHSINTTNYIIAADSILNAEITTDETENVKIYF